MAEPPVGNVNFHLKGTEFVATQPQGDKQAQKDTAKATADAVKKQLDTLFETAYVDPGSWGDTGAIGDLFTDGAKGQLKDDIATITLGDNAGDTYESVQSGEEQRQGPHADRQERERAARRGGHLVHGAREAR